MQIDLISFSLIIIFICGETCFIRNHTVGPTHVRMFMLMNSLVPISTFWFCFKLIFEFSSFEADNSDISSCFESILVFATLDMKIISISTNFGAKWHLLKQVTLHYTGVMETFVHSIISLPPFFFSLSLSFFN